jgi:RimJ/RimL family protein N-acetyltransferase
MDIYFKELNKFLIKKSDYVNWINDKNINSFLEVRFKKQSENDLINYVENINKSNIDFLFGIFRDDEHIGNVKLYNIDNNHKFADISIVIGVKNLQSQGIGTKAIEFIKSFAKNECKLRKVSASAYSINKSSINLFNKCGFKKVGEFKKQYFYGSKLVDKIYLESFL